MTTYVEIETKYDLADGVELPDLVGVAGVDSVVLRDRQVLTATYLDTADHALVSAGATLRRRSGGSDDGWHLKLPLADGERLEVRRGLGRGSTPPVALVSLVRAIVRASPVDVVATVTTRRTVHHLLAADGQVMAEMADDTVTAERAAEDGDPVEPLQWRELEIELVDGARSVLDELDAAVRAGGIAPAPAASKVGRLLGTGSSTPEIGRKTPVAVLFAVAMQQALRELQGADPLVRLDRPAACHRLRESAAQLRALLGLRRQVMPDEITGALRSELAWLDSVLGPVAALDTARDSIRAALRDEPAELVLGPVARRTERELAAARKPALAAAREALDSSRYLDVVDGVVGLVAPEGGGRAGDVLPYLADRAMRRAERRLEQLRRAQSDAERRRLVRDAARAVDRARSAELLASGRRRSVEVLDEVAEVLRDLQETEATQDLLRDMGVAAHLAGENGFTFGRLHGLLGSRERDLHRQAGALRKTVKRLRKA